jgi:hypothetical protein
LTDVLVVEEITILAVEAENTVLHEQVDVVEILAVAEQGPPGRDGNAAAGVLLAANRLAEFDTEAKKSAARANLGLQVIDGGTFF